MNIQSFIRKSSLFMIMMMILGVIYFLGTPGKASASSSGVYNDGKGCLWYKENSYWMGLCLQEVTSTSGNIWGYFGNRTNPWMHIGVYDAKYEYYFNFQGGYAYGVERTTGRIICPSGYGWFYSNACYDGNSADSYAVVGGNQIESPIYYTMPGSVNDSYLYAYVTSPFSGAYSIPSTVNSQWVDPWLAPNCNASYYGCR